jgi:hypothetical protein
MRISNLVLPSGSVLLVGTALMKVHAHRDVIFCQQQRAPLMTTCMQYMYRFRGRCANRYAMHASKVVLLPQGMHASKLQTRGSDK